MKKDRAQPARRRTERRDDSVGGTSYQRVPFGREFDHWRRPRVLVPIALHSKASITSFLVTLRSAQTAADSSLTVAV